MGGRVDDGASPAGHDLPVGDHVRGAVRETHIDTLALACPRQRKRDKDTTAPVHDDRTRKRQRYRDREIEHAPVPHSFFQLKVTLKLFSEPSKVIRVTEIVSDICACARIRSRPGNLLLVLALPALTHISSLFLKKNYIPFPPFCSNI